MEGKLDAVVVDCHLSLGFRVERMKMSLPKKRETHFSLGPVSGEILALRVTISRLSPLAYSLILWGKMSVWFYLNSRILQYFLCLGREGWAS